MSQEILDVLATIEPQGIFDLIHVQAATLAINREIVSIRRKSHGCAIRLRQQKRRFNIVSDSEGLLGMLWRHDLGISAAHKQQHSDEQPNNFRACRQHGSHSFSWIETVTRRETSEIKLRQAEPGSSGTISLARAGAFRSTATCQPVLKDQLEREL